MSKVAILAAKMSAAVAPEMNMRNPSCTGDARHKCRDPPQVSTQGMSQTGVPVAPQRTSPSKVSKNRHHENKNSVHIDQSNCNLLFEMLPEGQCN